MHSTAIVRTPYNLQNFRLRKSIETSLLNPNQTNSSPILYTWTDFTHEVFEVLCYAAGKWIEFVPQWGAQACSCVNTCRYNSGRVWLPTRLPIFKLTALLGSNIDCQFVGLAANGYSRAAREAIYICMHVTKTHSNIKRRFRRLLTANYQQCITIIMSYHVHTL